MKKTFKLYIVFLIIGIFSINIYVQADYDKPVAPTELKSDVIKSANTILDSVYNKRTNKTKFPTLESYIVYLDKVNSKLRVLKNTFPSSDIKYSIITYLSTGLTNIKTSVQDEIIQNYTVEAPKCATQPSYIYATFTIGNPTQTNQSWQSTNNTNPCYYACSDGYSGSDCSIAPQIQQFLGNCTASGQIYYGDNNGNKLASVTNTGVESWVSGKSISDLTCAGHITVCIGNNTGYTLQACNLGSTTVGTTASSYGNLYQFGKSDNSWTNLNKYDWKLPGGTNSGSANDWGVLDVNKSTATWLNSDETSRIKMQGPCLAGYHVPTNAEWMAVLPVQGSNLWKSMKNVLKMPLAGYHDLDESAGIMNQASNGYYWSSSPGEAGGYCVAFNSSNISSWWTIRSFAFSIRCFKN